LTRALSERITQLDEINIEMIDYMIKHRKARAGELAELIGITVPSIRARLFQLMASGIVCQEKTRDHHVWFFLKNETQ
jgi:transcription initiation factor IIE alpha subunit